MTTTLTKTQKARVGALTLFLSGGEGQAVALTALALARDSSALLSLLTRIGEVVELPQPRVRALLLALKDDPQVGRAVAIIQASWAKRGWLWED